MISIKLRSVAIAILLASACNQPQQANRQPEADPAGVGNKKLDIHRAQPNFLVIVADDLGYSDLGVFGGEIHTPTIDALARQGLLFTNFYAAGTCSPTRAMLLTGVDHHIAGLGNMTEHIAPNQIGQPGYEGYLNERVATISERLKEAGYNTYVTGKWHLGMTRETSPAARGFDRSFVLLNGGASHFDDKGLEARAHPAPYRENGERVELPDDFGYSTDYYTGKMIEYIDSGRDSGKPFFAYLAYTAPHWPLQAPSENIQKYTGVYDEGWDSVQAARFERMKAFGLIPSSAKPHPIVSDTSDWETLSAVEQKIEARKMEIYAGMVDRIDQQLSELVAHLKKSGEYENTVILFMSDNGAEGAPLDKAGPFRDWIKQFDNSYENMGAKGSYVHYGARWAQVSMTPLRLYKGFASEGGIRVPAFITFGGFENQQNQYRGVLTVMDIAPTLLELAGISIEKDEIEGRPLYAMQGRSIAPVLRNKSSDIRNADAGVGWELFNKRAFRRGNWKVVNMHNPWGTDYWQLYDLSVDPGETDDLALQYPDTLNDLVREWNEYALINGVILGNEPPSR